MQIQIRHKTANVLVSQKNVSYSPTSFACESCSINLNGNPHTNGPKMGHLTDVYNLKFKCEKRSGIIIVWSIPNSVYLKKSLIHIPRLLIQKLK